MSGFAPVATHATGRLTCRERYVRVHRQVRASGVPRANVEGLAAVFLGHSTPRVWLWVLSGVPRVSVRWFHRERRWHDRLPG